MVYSANDSTGEDRTVFGAELPSGPGSYPYSYGGSRDRAVFRSAGALCPIWRSDARPISQQSAAFERLGPAGARCDVTPIGATRRGISPATLRHVARSPPPTIGLPHA